MIFGFILDGNSKKAEDCMVRIDSINYIYDYVSIASANYSENIGIVIKDGIYLPRLPQGYTLGGILLDYNMFIYNYTENEKIKEIYVKITYDNQTPVEGNTEMEVINGVEHFISLGEATFYKDGLACIISTSNTPSIREHMDLLENVELVKYISIEKDTVRGNVYAETKIMDYEIDGNVKPLKYIYSEINYRLGLDYDVYTDDVNIYLFDTISGKNIGYINNETSSSESICNDQLSVANSFLKSQNIDGYILENDMKTNKGTVFEFIKCISKKKTDSLAVVEIDRYGNVVRYIYKEGFADEEKIKEDIDYKALDRELADKLDFLLLSQVAKYKHHKVIDSYYSVNMLGKDVLVCLVDVEIYYFKNGKKDNLQFSYSIMLDN